MNHERPRRIAGPSDGDDGIAVGGNVAAVADVTVGVLRGGVVVVVVVAVTADEVVAVAVAIGPTRSRFESGASTQRDMRSQNSVS
jgi:hypothetical protein